MLDYKAILHNAEMPNYVAPISLSDLDALQFHRGVAFSEKWPESMRKGWLRESRKGADAQTSAFLVGMGVAQ